MREGIYIAHITRLVSRLHNQNNGNSEDKRAKDMLRCLTEEASQTASKYMKICSASLIIRETN